MPDDLLDGLVLSDGCIQRAGRSRRWHYEQTCREPTLLEWVRRQIPGGDVAVQGPYGASGYYSIRTHVDQAYEQARERWYHAGRKGIPDGFEPTPESMRAAYLGDGSLSRDRAIRLALYAFPLADLQQLAARLAALGFDAVVHRLRPPYHEVVVHAASARDFLAWIGPCPVPAYAYKWAIRDYAPKVCGGCGCPRDEFTRGCAACRSRRWARGQAVKYGGRFDGTVTMPGGGDFAAAMLEAGHAVPYTGGPK